MEKRKGGGTIRRVSAGCGTRAPRCASPCGRLSRARTLDVRHAVVVVVQDAARGGQVKVVGAVLAPRHGREPVQVRPGDVELGRVALQHAQLLQLLVKHRLGGRRHRQPRRALRELGHQRVLVVFFQAQLLLDGLELLHEKVRALLLVDALLHVRLDGLLQRRQLRLLLEQQQRLAQPGLQLHRLQHVLQLARVGCGRQGASICGGEGRL
jgi:hypothetical protein